MSILRKIYKARFPRRGEYYISVEMLVWFGLLVWLLYVLKADPTPPRMSQWEQNQRKEKVLRDKQLIDQAVQTTVYPTPDKRNP